MVMELWRQSHVQKLSLDLGSRLKGGINAAIWKFTYKYKKAALDAFLKKELQTLFIVLNSEFQYNGKSILPGRNIGREVALA